MLDSLIKNSSLILTEGSIIERVKREFGYPVDEKLLNTPMIYDESGREILKSIYNEYIETARESSLPLILFTPTWRANFTNIENSRYKNFNVNKDAYLFIKDIVLNSGYNKIVVSGLMGPKGDAYKPEEAPGKNEAKLFHYYQAEKLKEAGVDFIMVSTLPALKEAEGYAGLFKELDVDAVISFVIDKQGRLLDGNDLGNAITKLDEISEGRLTGYFINCVHPANVINGLKGINSGCYPYKRILGMQGNSSKLNVEELDNADVLHEDSPEEWGRDMQYLNKHFNMKILGGCCGTNNKYLKNIISLD